MGLGARCFTFFLACAVPIALRRRGEGGRGEGGVYYALGLQFQDEETRPFPVDASRWPHITLVYEVIWGRAEAFYEFMVRAKALLRLLPEESFCLALIDPGRPVTSWSLRDCEVAGLCRVLQGLIQELGGVRVDPAPFNLHVSFRQL